MGEYGSLTSEKKGWVKEVLVVSGGCSAVAAGQVIFGSVTGVIATAAFNVCGLKTNLWSVFRVFGF